MTSLREARALFSKKPEPPKPKVRESPASERINVLEAIRSPRFVCRAFQGKREVCFVPVRTSIEHNLVSRDVIRIEGEVAESWNPDDIINLLEYGFNTLQLDLEARFDTVSLSGNHYPGRNIETVLAVFSIPSGVEGLYLKPRKKQTKKPKEQLDNESELTDSFAPLSTKTVHLDIKQYGFSMDVSLSATSIASQKKIEALLRKQFIAELEELVASGEIVAFGNEMKFTHKPCEFDHVDVWMAAVNCARLPKGEVHSFTLKELEGIKEHLDNPSGKQIQIAFKNRSKAPLKKPDPKVGDWWIDDRDNTTIEIVGISASTGWVTFVLEDGDPSDKYQFSLGEFHDCFSLLK